MKDYLLNNRSENSKKGNKKKFSSGIIVEKKKIWNVTYIKYKKGIRIVVIV